MQVAEQFLPFRHLLRVPPIALDFAEIILDLVGPSGLIRAGEEPPEFTWGVFCGEYLEANSNVLVVISIEYVSNNRISYNVFFAKLNNPHLAKSTKPVDSINKSILTTKYLHVCLFCVANQTDF